MDKHVYCLCHFPAPDIWLFVTPANILRSYIFGYSLEVKGNNWLESNSKMGIEEKNIYKVLLAIVHYPWI